MERVLDLNLHSKESIDLLSTLNRKVVGQPSAVQAVFDTIVSWKSGFCDPTRPIGNLLFLGPTGTGKTYTVETLCEALFGNPNACIKIDCGEFQHSHEIAKLIGSPPGYLGHRETHAVLTQEALNQYHTEKFPMSIVLFDEIEKSSDALWQLLLGILDKATLTLGDNRKIDFSKTIVIMTSNLGSDKIKALAEGGFGFSSQTVLESVQNSEIEAIAKQAAKKKFTPEFYNRLDKVIVFNTLTEEHIAHILQIELGRLQSRLMDKSKVGFFISVDKYAKKVLLTLGFDKAYGARHIRRAIEQKIQVPLSHLVESGQIQDRDVVRIRDVGEEDFQFSVVENDQGILTQ